MRAILLTVLILLLFDQVLCTEFRQVMGTKRKETLARMEIATLQGCQERCDADSDCYSVAYSEKTCALLGSPSGLQCTEPTEEWQKVFVPNGETTLAFTFPPTTTIKSACETCVDIHMVAEKTQLPVPFQTGYRSVLPNITRKTGQCTIVTCPDNYILMGFLGTTATQTGLEYLNQQFMKCTGDGQWTNGGLEKTPELLATICMQQNLDALPPCESCIDPRMTSISSQLPLTFQSDDYHGVLPILNRNAGQCATLTCPRDFVLKGFVGSNEGQTGGEYLNQTTMKCDEKGQWTNGGLNETPQNIKAICIQTILPKLSKCGCGIVPIFNLPSSRYCPFSAVSSCNTSAIFEDSCTISCPGMRTTLAYQNVSTSFLYTTSVKCENGNFSTGDGKKIMRTFNKPTCGFKAPCNNCPIAFESTCSEGYVCDPDSLKRSVDPTDGCSRVYCDPGLKYYMNDAVLTLYDEAKSMLSYKASKLYCGMNGKWYNYSADGSIGGGEVSGNISANCRVSRTCQNCLEPTLITNNDQLPLPFQTGYTSVVPTVNRPPFQCSSVTCPNGFLLMGFRGTNATQTGVEWLDQNFLKCTSGLWKNGWKETSIPQLKSGYNPPLSVICMQQKNGPCPPVDYVLGNLWTGVSEDVLQKARELIEVKRIFTITCDENTKVSTLRCSDNDKTLRIHYLMHEDNFQLIVYDQATFVAGKGWLAQGKNATDAFYTTAGGKEVYANCS